MSNIYGRIIATQNPKEVALLREIAGEHQDYNSLIDEYDELVDEYNGLRTSYLNSLTANRLFRARINFFKATTAFFGGLLVLIVGGAVSINLLTH